MRIPGAGKIMLAFLLTVGMTMNVRADSDSVPQEISLEAGAAFPTGVNHFSDSEKIGPVGGVRYLRMASPNFGWGVQADYYHFAGADHLLTSPSGGQLNARSSDNVVTAEIMGRYSILPDARVVPYLHAGLGANYFHQISNGEPAGGSWWFDTGTTETRQLQDINTVGFTGSAGIGMETYLTKSFVLGLEATWHVFGVSQTTFGTSAINVPSAALRLGWRFGHFTSNIFRDKPANF